MTTSPDNTILVTGFEAFGDLTDNPTVQLVQALDNEVIGESLVRGLVLPVVFGEAGDRLLAAIEEIDPGVVICLGLAANRQTISMERLAVNLDDADIPDNAGKRPVDQVAVPGGPHSYWSTLPVKTMLASLQEKQIPASLSMSAGTYVCNHVFYRLMHDLVQRPGKPGGFVHVPPLPGQVADNPGVAFDLLEQGIRDIIRVVLDTPGQPG